MCEIEGRGRGRGGEARPDLCVDRDEHPCPQSLHEPQPERTCIAPTRTRQDKERGRKRMTTHRRRNARQRGEGRQRHDKVASVLACAWLGSARGQLCLLLARRMLLKNESEGGGIATCCGGRLRGSRVAVVDGDQRLWKHTARASVSLENRTTHASDRTTRSVCPGACTAQAVAQEVDAPTRAES